MYFLGGVVAPPPLIYFCTVFVNLFRFCFRFFVTCLRLSVLPWNLVGGSARSGSLCLVIFSIIFIKVGNFVVMADVFEPEPVFSNLNLDDDCLDDVSFVETVKDVAAGMKLGDTNIKTPGRILGRIEAYIDSGASEYVVETVRVGYKLVFEGGVPPPPSFKCNDRSALQKPDFTYNELLRLESLGCIKRVSEQPHVVNPLSVVFSKKWRCVLDASQHLPG